MASGASGDASSSKSTPQKVSVAESWKSPRKGGKSWWGKSLVDMVAVHIWDSMPPAVHNLIESDGWKGGDVVILKDKVNWSVKAADVHTNFLLLQQLMKHFPGHVPSSFMLGDVFVALHEHSGNNLFGKGTCPDMVKRAATQEGVKAKRLVGYLRQLAKDSDRSYNPRIDKLKAMVEFPKRLQDERPEESASQSGFRTPQARKPRGAKSDEAGGADSALEEGGDAEVEEGDGEDHWEPQERPLEDDWEVPGDSADEGSWQEGDELWEGAEEGDEPKGDEPKGDEPKGD
ncbi:unnamed protein product, partial [Prorocentrum cordatum]